NNSDHSMLTAMVAVDNIAARVVTKTNIWAINTEQEYHEEKTAETTLKQESNDKSITKQPIWELNLKNFIFKNPAHELYVWVAIIAMIAQFVNFKFLYPYPS